MPDTTMDGLPPAGPLTGSEILPMVQGGSDRRDTLNSILAFLSANYTGVTNLSPSVNATTVTISSDTGADATIPAATAGDAGVMTASDKSKLNGIASGATANSSDAFLLSRLNHTGLQALATIGDVSITASDLNALDDGANTTLHFHDSDRLRSNHTGTQLASTISNFSEAVDDRVSALLVAGTNITLTYNDPTNTLTIDAATQVGTTNLSTTVAATTVTVVSDTGADAVIPAATATDAGVMSAADKSKLDGIASGATVNSSDATLLARANHTGTQSAATISDFSEAVDDRVSALLVAGTNITLTYNDPANTLTIDASSSAPPLTATRIGYGDGSNVLTGTANFTWDNTNQRMTLGSGTGPSRIFTANAVSGAGASSLTIQTGDANAGVVGAGLLSIQGGAGAGASAAGSIAIGAGSNPSTGPGGSITIFAGTSSGGTSGNLVFQTGGLDRITVANTGTTTFAGAIVLSSTLNGTSAVFSSTLSATSGTFSSTLECTSIRVTGSTGPDNGMYLQATGVVGLAANNVAAYKYGSNAFLSQTGNTRDLGEVGTPWRDIFSQNAVTVTSDKRSKTDIQKSNLGLNFIRLLEPKSYRQLVGHNKVTVLDDENHTNVVTPVPGTRRHHAFLSQDVKKALDTLGVSSLDFAGWVLSNPDDPESLQALRYEEFTAPIVNAMQELDGLVVELQSQLQEQASDISSLKAQVQVLMQLLKVKSSK